MCLLVALVVGSENILGAKQNVHLAGNKRPLYSQSSPHLQRRYLLSAQCDPGEVNRVNSANCAKCTPGFFSHNISSWHIRQNCAACPAGLYTSEYGSVSCKPCESGTFSNVTSRPRACESCATGKYSEITTGALECKFCPAGQYQNVLGQIECKKCATGTFVKDEGQKLCVDCKKGWFADVLGLGLCKACAPGKYQAISAQENCDDCQAGKFSSSPSQYECDECAVGRYSESGLHKCRYCQAGQYQVSTMIFSRIMLFYPYIFDTCPFFPASFYVVLSFPVVGSDPSFYFLFPTFLLFRPPLSPPPTHTKTKTTTITHNHRPSPICRINKIRLSAKRVVI